MRSLTEKKTVLIVALIFLVIFCINYSTLRAAPDVQILVQYYPCILSEHSLSPLVYTNFTLFDSVSNLCLPKKNFEMTNRETFG